LFSADAFCNHMLMESVTIVICCYSTDVQRHAPTICTFKPLGMTGRICQKSPPKTTITPPKED
jgi:hypothetical protein